MSHSLAEVCCPDLLLGPPGSSYPDDDRRAEGGNNEARESGARKQDPTKGRAPATTG